MLPYCDRNRFCTSRGYIVCITDNDCPENTEVRQYECIEGRCRLSRVLNP
ncbi:Nodule Cysteine-Rich (NCR) secreted peptide [Medicago truncatula]|uniref:Nodule Cysteine-Rich (NCR) secreted peptide n=1 Tax=Medicago truncatula TaxID=3880 RepID=A0A072UT81_MEDTR|nr:Nodule Cysteine-Rich (NCR) secreted peptide [Medicago truncatula]